jgi:hypothetical protein
MGSSEQRPVRRYRIASGLFNGSGSRVRADRAWPNPRATRAPARLAWLDAGGWGT